MVEVAVDNKPDKESRIQSVKKFYFLDYFYIFLRSIKEAESIGGAFSSFLSRKNTYRLGESKYRKLTLDRVVPEEQDASEIKIRRFLYTFNQVFAEASEYKLVSLERKGKRLHLSKLGIQLLKSYEEQGATHFYENLFKLMEENYGAFRYLTNTLYAANKKKPGLLVLPSYSPRQLGFERNKMRLSGDFWNYSNSLVNKLENDVREYIGDNVDLSNNNIRIFQRIVDSGLLSKNLRAKYDTKKYNVITKRFRDYWMSYFLREIYGYAYSMTSFDFWTYRGKQIGILHATEFHPEFNGKIVYPLSVILKSTESMDFKELFMYADNNKLYIHEPIWSQNQEKFVDSLVGAYYQLRRVSNNYFVNLMSLREIVCMNMKISERLFEEFLNTTYLLNLAGQLRIRISLEVDKLPEETGAMYLKREPVMVDGKYRNIIAIDISKAE